MTLMNAFVVFYLVSTWLYNLITLVKQRPNHVWIFINSYLVVGVSMFILDYYIGVLK